MGRTAEEFVYVVDAGSGQTDGSTNAAPTKSTFNSSKHKKITSMVAADNQLARYTSL